jgi:hypothetical protein
MGNAEEASAVLMILRNPMTLRKPLVKRLLALNSFKEILKQKQIHMKTLHTYSY